MRADGDEGKCAARVARRFGFDGFQHEDFSHVSKQTMRKATKQLQP
jgi:hypothetical protein